MPKTGWEVPGAPQPRWLLDSTMVTGDMKVARQTGFCHSRLLSIRAFSSEEVSTEL